jgi:YfiH family protein
MNSQEGMAPDSGLLRFPALLSPLLFHGVFKRSGGVSPAPWDSRNVSFGLGDDPRNVRTNRDGIKKALACALLVSARQVHKEQVFVVQEKPEADLEIEGFDAMISNVPGLGLMIQQADCQAVMLFDPRGRAVGIAHAGWRGSVADIISKTVFAMRDAFATEPPDLIAAISPSLGPCCAEFVNYRTELPASLHTYQVRPNYFDFWAISRDQLRTAGVRLENIHTAGICTCCSRDYFSYRREGETGRSASVIGLQNVQYRAEAEDFIATEVLE